jgi:hypothetical protein
MCNLYSLSKGQAAINDMTRAMLDRTGNLPLLPGIFPDYSAPIVRNSDAGRELTMARWGMPSPVFALKGRKTDPGITNVRNTASPHWRRWLAVESRCVVPFTSFSENEVLADGSRPTVWFALSEDRPLAMFCRHLDALDVGKEGKGGRDDKRCFRLPHNRAQCGSGRHSPQGHAGDPHDASRDRSVADSVHGRGTETTTALA